MTGDKPRSRTPAAGPPPPPDTRVTPRQVARWRRSGLVRDGGHDLAQLRMIGTLRRAGISLGRIRAAFDRAATGPDAATRGSGYDVRRYAVYADELYVQHNDGTWEGDRRPGQLVLDEVLPLRPIDVAVVTEPAARSARSTVTRPAPPDRSPGRIVPVDPTAPARPTGPARPILPARPIVPADAEAIRRFLAIQDHVERPS
ncbi:hypothetical protein ND748_04800 [Frankia sp. AiPs1]|uniref:hypothetical protein n=1 Tax=Frankia sp. AiPs1 TaxID=573493 RepID=UPI002042FB0E|nr:hypothetical protein [Frankia sp. AiPs1]MCM3920995.1 hypothetical protein [Frankia sp. AiPs1]